ncbi:unnamed protein product, partial [marine sediment metagenome]
MNFAKFTEKSYLPKPARPFNNNALERAKGRGDLDRIETEATQFFERVQNTYFTLAEQNPDRYRCIDAGQAPKQV